MLGDLACVHLHPQSSQCNKSSKRWAWLLPLPPHRVALSRGGPLLAFSLLLLLALRTQVLEPLLQQLRPMHDSTQPALWWRSDCDLALMRGAYKHG